MLDISPQHLHQLREALENCAPIDSDEKFHAVFIDSRISRWHNNIPQATDVTTRINLAIDFLRNRYDDKQQNALILLLYVLADGVPDGDSCKQKFLRLAQELKNIEVEGVSESNLQVSDTDIHKNSEKINRADKYNPKQQIQIKHSKTGDITQNITQVSNFGTPSLVIVVVVIIGIAVLLWRTITTEISSIDLNSNANNFQIIAQGKIALATTAYGFAEIVLLDVSTDEISRLTYSNVSNSEAGIYNWAPTLSPNGSVVAYVSKENNRTEIYAIASIGGKSIKLTEDMNPVDYPTWSSNGQSLYFSSKKSDNWQLYEITLKPELKIQDAQEFLNDLSVSENPTLLNASEYTSIRPIISDNNYNDTHPTASPDGNKIAFISDRSEVQGLYVLNMHTNIITPLVTSIDAILSPSWSPDGKNILFVSDEEENDYMGTIHMVSADGSDLKSPFIMLGDSYVGYPDWSPDNQYIAFSRAMKEGRGNRATYLYFASLDGVIYNNKIGNLESADRRRDESVNVWGASWSY